jgi:3-hydroxyisobutyrate dehydrogenase-like beta-hydroxyacid dehydrogenase
MISGPKPVPEAGNSEAYMKVGFIGLGAMGLPMARCVVKAGYPLVTTFHRNRGPADELAALGAKVVTTAAEVAAQSDVVITILPADAELEESVLGPDGVVKGMTAGKVLIDMTTCTARTVIQIAEKIQALGGRMLDAPVSGGTVGAESATLTIMIGGDSALLEEFRPLLATMGTRIVHVGKVGHGKVIKILNQALAAIHLLAIGEVFALGIRCGMEENLIYDVIKESSGHSRMMDARLQFLFAGAFEPGFKLDLMKKDVLLALDSARQLSIPVLLTSSVAQLFTAASSAGYGNEDFSRAAEYVAGLAGATLKQGAMTEKRGG